MGFNESEAARETNQEVTNPRLRVNKMTNQTVTTTPTKILYNGTSPFNGNFYTVIPGETTPSVWYDATSNLFRFTSNTDKNYNLDMTFVVTTAGLLAIGLANISFRVQLEIPSPTPIKFPAPDFGGYIDADNVNFNGQKNIKLVVPFFAEQNIRQYGFSIKVYLSSPLPLGSVTLNGADVNLYPI